ncbi:MAG: hypothetical protein KatS3mg021_0592 [Fimbriimonadales bacterium]|nr:MAG: hypothetical protein KatS3mg021_0592 [Fimbriimonadales bacterium]
MRPYFASPGYWGRIAYLYNPSDLRGAYANVSWKPSEDLNVRVGGAFLEGTGRVAGGYTKNDEVVHAVAGIDYRLSDRWNVSLNYEGAFWKVGGVKPVWNYVTVGLGYNLGENASWNLLYQIIDNDGKGNAGVQRRSQRQQEPGRRRRDHAHHQVLTPCVAGAGTTPAPTTCLPPTLCAKGAFAFNRVHFLPCAIWNSRDC